MRSSGVLRSWNDERGFGFIAPTQGGPELFVHLSAFPRDGTKPVVGETVSFELGRARDGRPQAVQVIRAAVGNATPRPHATLASARRSSPSRLRAVVLIVVLIAGGAWGHRYFQKSSHRWQLERSPANTPQPLAAPAKTPTPATPAEPATSFRCDGRTQCSQMTSCDEATWFINHCPGTKMDGNHDGVPCEQQWCLAR